VDVDDKRRRLRGALSVRESLALLVLVAAAGLLASCQPAGDANKVDLSSSITITPNTIRCDGSARTATIRLSATPNQLATEVRSGGLNGPILLTGSTTLDQLGTRQADGSYEATYTATDSWDCLQPPGRYGLIIRDPTSHEILASGEFSIED